jgi:hypothetical protein
MTDRSDDRAVAVAVDSVWRQLRPALERHYAEPAAFLRPLGRRPGRRRGRRAIGFGLALAVVGTGGAVAARALLGDPAPPSVQASIAAVDEGMPADLRLQPDVANARSVARDGDAVLYAADLPDGGTCTELAVAGRPAGAICVRGGAAAPIEASIPGTPEDTSTPVVVGGRVNVAADRAIAVVDGSQRFPVVLEPGGYYVLSLDSVASAAARRGLSLEALQGDAVVASVDLTDAFTVERPLAEPLTLELISGDGDLTRVVSVYGTVTVPGAAAVRLLFPDGTAAEVAVGPDGRYELMLPVDRQADLADRPGRVVALDAAGHELASRAVAAVSWWRSHEGDSAGR